MFEANYFKFKLSGYRLKIGVYNKLDSTFKPIDFIKMDILIWNTPFQPNIDNMKLTYMEFAEMKKSGNRTLALPTMLVCLEKT